MLIPQYQVLVLKLSLIYRVSLNTVFSIPQNQCYPGTPCIKDSEFLEPPVAYFAKLFETSFRAVWTEQFMTCTLNLYLPRLAWKELNVPKLNSG